MVITKDFESFNPASSSGRTFFAFTAVREAQLRRALRQRRTRAAAADAHASMPERSKGADLRSAGLLSAWVQTPPQAQCRPSGQMDKASVSGAEDCGFESHLG